MCALARNDAEGRSSAQERYRAGMGSNDDLCTVHELAVGPNRQNRLKKGTCNDTERVWEVTMLSAPCTNRLSVLTDKTGTTEVVPVGSSR